MGWREWGLVGTVPSTGGSYGQMGREALIPVNEITAFSNYVCGGAIEICLSDFSLNTGVPFQVCSRGCCDDEVVYNQDELAGGNNERSSRSTPDEAAVA